MENPSRISTEQLSAAKSLYCNELRHAIEVIRSISDKYQEEPEYTLYILKSMHDRLEYTFLKILFDDNANRLEEVVNETKEKIKKLKSLSLLEIAHRKSVGIKFKIGSPLFFEKSSRSYRELTTELNEIQNEISQNQHDEHQLELTQLKLANLIERFKNLDFELLQESKTGTYNFLGKLLVWGFPILIGIYQLIAMQYFRVNPIIPLIVYFVIFVSAYLILKANYIKIIFINLKTAKDYLNGVLNNFMIYFPIVLITLLYIQGKIEKELPLVIILALMALLFAFIRLKYVYEHNKNVFIRNELKSIKLIIYNLESMSTE